MNKNLLYILGGGFLAYWTYRLYQSTRSGLNLNVSIDGIDFDVKKREAIVYVKIINPLNAEVSFDSVVADCYWNDNLVGTINYQTKTTIPGNKTLIVKMPVQFQLTGGISLLWEILTKGKDSLSGAFAVKGNVFSSGLKFPIDYTYKFSLPKSK